VGFGAFLLDLPLPFETDVEHCTAMGKFLLTESDGMFSLNVMQPAGWRTAYVFNLEPQIPSDYELANWYTSTSPRVPFVSTLIIERLASDRRYKLVNNRFTIETRDGEVVDERVISSADDFGRVLDQTFRISPPAPVREIFARFGG
jgi:N-hydroxyarylamine O-acetyltransferase